MRLVTRADLDGLACAILLQEVEAIDAIEFVHPKDVQDGKVELGPHDILANLPYDARAGMWFDHHASEAGAAAGRKVEGAFATKPSAARVIADHYRHPTFGRYEELLRETDRLDSAQLEMADVTDPSGWILLGYTVDPRTGLGAFREYFRHVVELCRTYPVEQVLDDPQVQERVAKVKADQDAFATHLHDVAELRDNVIYMDVRGLRGVPSGNRFLVYTLFPKANVSLRVADGKGGEFVSVQVGHSIFNRTCTTDVGALMRSHGGGGHRGAGTCQPPVADAERVVAEVLAALRAPV
jgi:hypothetical protein